MVTLYLAKATYAIAAAVRSGQIKLCHPHLTEAHVAVFGRVGRGERARTPRRGRERERASPECALRAGARFVGSVAARCKQHRSIVGSWQQTCTAAGSARETQHAIRQAIAWRHVERALEGVEAVVYLVHAMGQSGDFEQKERAAAKLLARAAEQAGAKRVVYLGGVAPSGRASKHLRSRLATGELLRQGRVPTIELRAGMIIGAGGLSWQMVRDLAARLPFMVLPNWLQNRSQPVAIDDVVAALVSALELEPEVRGVFDLPGPETLSGEDILRRIAGLLGVKPYAVRVPVITPRLSSYWLKLVTRADFHVAQELVEGLTSDLVAQNAQFWQFMPDHRPTTFDAAARKALAEEEPRLSSATRLFEWSLQHLARRAHPGPRGP